MNKEKAVTILAKLKDHYGYVRPGLDFTSLYELTVSVVLSAQTTDVQVNAITPTLFSKYPDFAALAKAKQLDIEKIIHSTGFYRNKAKNIIALSKAVTERFNGKTPETLEELTSLPGVGRKSANVIISMGLGKPAIAVDTHVTRLAQRLGFTIEKNPDKIEQDLMKHIPEELWIDSHLLLIHHGRNICIARKPLCKECPIIKLCPWEEKVL